VREEPVILLDEGAKDVGLADMVFNLIRQNLEQKPHRLSSFLALNSRVAITARDIDITVTLMFEQGRLIIEGDVGSEAHYSCSTNPNNPSKAITNKLSQNLCPLIHE
jgi:hypothetical protein